MSIKTLLGTCETIERQLAKLEEKPQKIGNADANILLLQTIPRTDLITARTFKMSIGDPTKFSQSKNVRAYFGITP
ncbi:Transposase IS116/IS110/IS902 family protein [Neochlamydia sp. S13]|nr:Transposase IS116/IS110/IS902 family protein [Neochlamydia sp. S13]